MHFETAFGHDNDDDQRDQRDQRDQHDEHASIPSIGSLPAPPRIRRLTPKRLVSLITSIIALYGIARTGVSFSEAFASVREERAQDAELLLLCARGDARASPKMREACLKARADKASPVLMKALVTAVNKAFAEFMETFGSPFKLAALCMFFVFSILSPMLPYARALFGVSVSADGAGHAGIGGMPPSHFVVIAPPRIKGKGGSWRRKIPLLRSKPSIHEVGGDGDDDDFEDCEESHAHQD